MKASYKYIIHINGLDQKQYLELDTSPLILTTSGTILNLTWGLSYDQIQYSLSKLKVVDE